MYDWGQYGQPPTASAGLLVFKRSLKTAVSVGMLSKPTVAICDVTGRTLTKFLPDAEGSSPLNLLKTAFLSSSPLSNASAKNEGNVADFTK